MKGDTVLQCRLCGKDIEHDSLFCRFCHAVFHRACIVDHLYYNGNCPECKKEISLFDLEIGTPGEYIPGEIRKPLWPQPSEVPLFDEVTLERVTAKKVAPQKVTPQKIVFTPKKSFTKGLKSFYLPEKLITGFKQSKKGMFGLYMLLIAVVLAVCAPLLILHDPVIYMSEDAYVYHHPTWKYPLGTDVFGRDVYSQTIWGFRSALVVAVPSALLVGIIGTVVGLVSGYYGGWVDAVLQRISITFLVWPSVPLVALIVFSWGPFMALPAVILGVAFTLWPTTARAVRAEVLSLKNRAFVESAKVCGASSPRIIFRHILPKVIHVSFLYMTIAVASALVLEATFNFLGLTSPAVITWGQMLSFTYHASSAAFGAGGGISWWTIAPPAGAIAYMVVSFFLISAGLRESLKITSWGF